MVNARQIYLEFEPRTPFWRIIALIFIFLFYCVVKIFEIVWDGSFANSAKKKKSLKILYWSEALSANCFLFLFFSIPFSKKEDILLFTDWISFNPDHTYFLTVVRSSLLCGALNDRKSMLLYRPTPLYTPGDGTMRTSSLPSAEFFFLRESTCTPWIRERGVTTQFSSTVASLTLSLFPSVWPVAFVKS